MSLRSKFFLFFLNFYFLSLVLDNERWKAYEVPVEIQFLVSHISANGKLFVNLLKFYNDFFYLYLGLSLPLKKIEATNQKLNEYLLLNNEKYVVAAYELLFFFAKIYIIFNFIYFRTVLVLVKLMAEYCQFVIDMPSLSFDVMTRLIEIFKVIF